MLQLFNVIFLLKTNSMKRSILILALVAAFICEAKSQVLPTANSREMKNIFKMSASMFVRNTFQIGYERFLDPGTSLYLSSGLTVSDTESDDSWGIITEAQMKFHVYTLVKPNRSHRLYFAPYLQNHYMDTRQQVYDMYGYKTWYDDTFDAFGGGMLFGWSYSFANRINLDIYTGGGLRKSFGYEDNTYWNDIWDYRRSGIIPRLGIDIGFWF